MKKVITNLYISLVLVLISVPVHAFEVGEVIGFDAGEVDCIMPDMPQLCIDYPQFFIVVVRGSYIAVDVNGNGQFEPHERIAVSPGPDGGIIVGQLQPASGSHGGCPDGTENPSVDQPWCFYNNTGMQQIIGNPVYDNGDGTLDFSGWSITWGPVAAINFDAINAAVLACNTSPCRSSSFYTVDYETRVAAGDPSGFGGVGFKVHLVQGEDSPAINVLINVEGGGIQECTETGGNHINISADIDLRNGAVLDSVEWTVDGQPAGSAASISQFLVPGTHSVSVKVTGVSGAEASAAIDVVVEDTVAPAINAAFIDTRSGEVISSIETRNTSYVGVSMDASDVCDAAPSITGFGGFPVADGDLLKIQGNLDKVELTTSTIRLQARAVDASGNASEEVRNLLITP
jgi:hypothetical protein